jgi:hypothetical protein
MLKYSIINRALHLIADMQRVKFLSIIEALLLIIIHQDFMGAL